jgi:2-keto-4-pentenoate hydratase/2-oxohepta-3-ene-1,7-dioic acid hydratase in catechol pathway
MRIANLSGRLVIVTDGGAVDVEKISDGRFPAPRQLFAIGLNYRAHALEAGFAIPEDPPVFGGASGAGDRVRYPHRVRRHPAGGRSGARLIGVALWPRSKQNGMPSASC